MKANLFKKIESVGDRFIVWCESIASAGVFISNIFLVKPDKELLNLFLKQLYNLGMRSLPIIGLSALFIGMVAGLQGYTTLNKFGATAELGQLIALSITRELAPVISGLLFAGRAGSALTAEIGLMRTTNQLISMEMMAVNPMRQIIQPRFLAGFIALPMLTIIFMGVSIYAGYVVGVNWLGIDSGSFLANMASAVSFSGDILNGIIKSVVFSFIVLGVSLYQGYNAAPNSEGVSTATTRSVVISSVLILLLDFLLTLMMLGG